MTVILKRLSPLLFAFMFLAGGDARGGQQLPAIGTVVSTNPPGGGACSKCLTSPTGTLIITYTWTNTTATVTNPPSVPTNAVLNSLYVDFPAAQNYGVDINHLYLQHDAVTADLLTYNSQGVSHPTQSAPMTFPFAGAVVNDGTPWTLTPAVISLQSSASLQVVLYLSWSIPPPPPPQPGTPAGNLDTANSQDGVLSGWAFDPNASSASIYVDIYPDGGTVGMHVPANQQRADVNAAFHITGSHGFSVTVPAQFMDGQIHHVYAYAISITGQGNPLISGSPAGTFQVALPRGTIDTRYSDHSGNISGWAYDPSAPSVSNFVDLYIDGPFGSGAAGFRVLVNGSRPDVNTAFGITGSHGFGFALPAQYRDNKAHTVYGYVLGTRGQPSQALGNSPQSILVTAPPIGVFESISSSGVATGWAYDPDQPTLSITIDILGSAVTVGSASVPRPDVNAAHGITGNHGFSIQLPDSEKSGVSTTFNATALDSAGGPSANLNSIVTTLSCGPGLTYCDVNRTCQAAGVSCSLPPPPVCRTPLIRCACTNSCSTAANCSAYCGN